MSDPNVSRETSDEQTRQPSDAPSPDDARLINDLHRVYQPLAASNARSLERVRARLEHQEARLPRSRSEPPHPPIFPQRLQAEEQAMKSVFSIFSQGSAWRRGIGALAAMLLLAVLVGSMAAVFALARQSKSGNNPNQQHTAPAGATPTEAPPPSSPGIYIATEKNFGDYQVGKLNPQTRQQVWARDVGAITSSIIVYGATVYVTAGNPDPYAAPDNDVYALDANTGVIRWKVAVSNDTFHAPDGSGPYDLGVLSTPTIAQGTLVVGARDGKY